ncbi:cytochrome P450 [Streptomyces sp. NPDC058231]|uniref:cytochrome P450 family protein n=1 Tax=Streptomyces sp. NPDC058231 TaxID=3346392 RepID=UPI0036E2DBC5
MAKCPFDGTPFDAAYFDDPYARYSELREESPVHRVWLPEGVPVWLVTRYEDVHACLNDKRLVRSRKHANSDYRSELLPEAVRDGNLHMEDGEIHTRLRRFMNFAFTPKRIAALRPRMDEVADALLEKLATAGGGDLMADFAEPLPIAIIVDILGIPRDMGGDFHLWSDQIMCGVPEDAQKGGAALIQYTYQLIARKREEPGDDLLSHWVHGKDEEGKGLSEQEIVGMAFFLLLGGYITTFGSFGTAVLGLLTRPEKAEELRAHPELIPAAVEEFLRWDGSAQNSIRRFAVEELELAGTRIGKGDTVMLSIGSANRDPRRFPEPDEMRFDREDSAQHLTFGRGTHHCPGKELARIELQVMIAKLLQRFPDLALAVPADSVTWRPNYTFRAPRSLPVTV